MAHFLLFICILYQFMLPAFGWGDSQLKTLENCQTIFSPKNEKLFNELKRVVSDAVAKLPSKEKEPEKREEIENPVEFFKIVSDYKKAKKHVGKPIHNRHRIVVESMETVRQTEGKHITKYWRFMEELKTTLKVPAKNCLLIHCFSFSHGSALDKIKVIMGAQKICDEMNSNNVAQKNVKKKSGICKELVPEIYSFFKEVGITKVSDSKPASGAGNNGKPEQAIKGEDAIHLSEMSKSTKKAHSSGSANTGPVLAKGDPINSSPIGHSEQLPASDITAVKRLPNDQIDLSRHGGGMGYSGTPESDDNDDKEARRPKLNLPEHIPRSPDMDRIVEE